MSSVGNRCWKDVSSGRNKSWKDVSSVAQLSNAVVQPASMLAQPSSMLAQLRIWIGYGSDLVFERRPKTSSTARFSQAADHPETRCEPPPNQVRESIQSRCENLSHLISFGFAPGFGRLAPGFERLRTWFQEACTWFRIWFSGFAPGFAPGLYVAPGSSRLRTWIGASNPGAKLLKARA